jgi:hypothetical protein
MRLLLLAPLLAALLGAPTAGAAQAVDHPWRVGVVLILPTQILDATDGEVTSALGFGLESSRRWRLDTDLHPYLRARLARVATSARRGSNRWDPGAFTMLDLVVGAQHPITPVLAVHAGLGLGLWNGPDAGAPFAALGSLRPLAEFGADVFPTERLRVRLGFSGTTIPADEARAQSAGYLWRTLIGVSRAF